MPIVLYIDAISVSAPVGYLNVLPLTQLSRPHRLLLPPRLLPTEHVQLSLRPPCLQIVPTFLALNPVLFQNAEKFHYLFQSGEEDVERDR